MFYARFVLDPKEIVGGDIEKLTELAYHRNTRLAPALLPRIDAVARRI